ncbi:SH3 domain-containing protein [Schnuerera sp. xch1]|uniref:SH3 domain-containing protein n=1 Tax=Schnuerera sp. xch1 TaxID=2874283 RepID=UPI001CBBF838|nr:SH3 domain-containing protein [Schnuerera sp. xch1]MBZ2174181.1 SH3 domain-containing protein [Schnuerera sp. xch1]
MKKLKMILVILLLFTFNFNSISCAKNPNSNDNEKYKQFQSNIPKVTEDMLYPEFWIKNASKVKKVLNTPEEIEAYNRENVDICEPVVNLENYQESFTKEELTQLIEGISKPSSSPRYNNKGEQVGKEYYDELIKNLNLKNLDTVNEVRYGITVRRTEMRTFPTYDRLYSSPNDYNIDRSMETAVYPIEPMVILSESTDGEWYFAQIYNYLGWLPAKDVAITDKDTLFNYVNREDFLVVTGRRIHTNYNYLKPQISELQLDMGVRIPLAIEDEIREDFYGQNPAGNFVVKLPIRNKEGTLEFDYALISRLADINLGYLPYTRENIINQAFKFQGERYGWGGMFNARDCSALMMDIYRTFGVKLPRNASEQGKLATGVFHEFSEKMTLDEREKILDKLGPGIGLYMDGHAMLYLGEYKGEYYAIHDFSGFYTEIDGEVVYKNVWEVAVTPLSILRLSDDIYKTYLEVLYGAREFILQNELPNN